MEWQQESIEIKGNDVEGVNLSESNPKRQTKKHEIVKAAKSVMEASFLEETRTVLSGKISRCNPLFNSS